MKNDNKIERTAFETMLLQQYRILLIRSLVLAVSSRVLFLMILLFSIALDLNLVHSVTLSIAAIIISFAWYFEQKMQRNSTFVLEKALTKGIDREELEDLYIKYSHMMRHSYSISRILSMRRLEPLIWVQLVTMALVATYMLR